MANIMPFDALNALKDALPAHFENGRIKSEADLDSILDMLEDLFLLAYANGVELTNESLSSSYKPTLDEVYETVDKEIAGKTWRERVKDYYSSGGSEGDIVRIAETETHRDSNEAAYRTAKAAGATTKTWHCMMLPTSRDSHVYLDGVDAPIDGEFFSPNGGKTQFPGEWGIAEEDCGCLCWLTFS